MYAEEITAGAAKQHDQVQHFSFEWSQAKQLSLFVKDPSCANQDAFIAWMSILNDKF